MTYRVLLLQGGQIFCLTMKTVYVYVFRTASATVYCTVKQLPNDRRAEICARLQWQGCTGTFTMIVADEQLHFYRLCGTSMYSNVLGVSYRSILVQYRYSISIPLFRSQVRINNIIIQERHLASYLVYRSEGSTSVAGGDRDIRNQSTHQWG